MAYFNLLINRSFDINVLIIITFLIVLKMTIFWHLVLIILNQIIDVHDQIHNAVLVLNITCGILYQIEILNHLKELLIQVQVFFIEIRILIIKAVFKIHAGHSIK